MTVRRSIGSAKFPAQGPGQARDVLLKMASRNELDAHVVDALFDRFDEMNTARRAAQVTALAEYSAFRRALFDAGSREGAAHV